MRVPKDGFFLRLVAISVTAAFALCLVSIFCLARFADYTGRVHRESYLFALAESIEQRIADLSDLEIRNGLAQDRLDKLRPSLPRGREHSRPRRPFGDFWLVNSGDEVLFSSDPRENPPQDWTRIERPDANREISARQDFLRLYPGLFMLKLNREPKLYLLIKERRPAFMAPLFFTQAALTFGTVLTALLLSFSITFYYLRRKSQQARAVLLRLERGDLKARFTIHRFDEFGGLLLDFNRMAGEIEHLVGRLKTSEATRTNLLQELGHDLRTPLTSLKTSFENLRFHREKMSEQEQREAYEMIAAEVDYFKELLEKLMVIATFDEPHYKNSTQAFSLEELVAQELRFRRSGSPLEWSFKVEGTQRELLGDPQLVQRLLKNAYDNAARYARSKVETSLSSTSKEIVLKICDDGAGLSPEEISRFAKRREQRSFRQGESLDISLGLGSVIMKTIVELHGGTLTIANRVEGQSVRGAELEIRFPKVLPEHRNDSAERLATS